MTNKPFMIHLPSERLLDLNIDSLKKAIKKAKVTDVMLRLKSFVEQPTPGLEVQQFLKWCTANSINIWYCRWFWPGSKWTKEQLFSMFDSQFYKDWAAKVRAELHEMWSVGHIVADVEPYMKESWANILEGGLPDTLVKEFNSVIPAYSISGVIPVVNRPAVSGTMAHFSEAFKNWGTYHFRQEMRYVNSPVINTPIDDPNDWWQHCVTPGGVKWNNSKTWTPEQIASIISIGKVKVLIYTDSNIKTDIVDVLERIGGQWT